MNDRITQITQLLLALAPVFAIIILFLQRIVASMAPGKKKDAAQFVLQQADVIVREGMHEVNDRKDPSKPATAWTDADKARIKDAALTKLLTIAEGEIKIAMGTTLAADVQKAVSSYASSVIEASVHSAKSGSLPPPAPATPAT
jgi:hypothetical protein